MYVIYHICFFQYMLYACILHDSFFCVWINFMLSWILMIFFVWELPMKESPSLEGEAARLESWYENTVGLASEKYGFNHLRLAELHVFKFNPSSFQVFFKTHPIPRGEPGFSLQHTQSKMPSHFKIPSKNVYVYIYICIFLYTRFDVKLVNNPTILRSKKKATVSPPVISHRSQPRFNGFVSRRFQGFSNDQVDFKWIFQGLIPGWWFQTFFIFIPIWGNDPNWLIFFRWVETTS